MWRTLSARRQRLAEGNEYFYFSYLLSYPLMSNFHAFPLSAAGTRLLLALLLLVFRLPAAAQAPAWQSARTVAAATAAATANYASVAATVVDAGGNVYLAGNFRNSVVLGGTALTSLGATDGFVAKFSPVSNQFVWVQQVGGTGNDFATAVAVTGTSVYVAGGFTSSTAGFGALGLTNANAASTGAPSADVFVAKLADAGNTSSFVWAHRAGGTGNDFAYALAVSGPSVYVAGSFFGTSAGFGATTLASAGAADVFVTKLTDAGGTGGFVWAQRAGGAGSDTAYALAASGTGLYVAGDFTSASAGFGAATLASAGVADVFVARLADAGGTGNFVWAQQAGGGGFDYATALAANGTGVYVAGRFLGPLASFGNTTLANAGSADVFVAKLNDAGSFVWAQRAGGAGSDAAYALAASGTGVYVAGYFESASAGFGATVLANAGGADVFVAKLTDAGGFAWAQQAGGAGNDFAYALAVGGRGVFVAGDFSSPSASFGALVIPNFNSTATGFLASLTEPALTATKAAGTRAPAALYPNPARRTAVLRLPAGMAPRPLILTDARGRAVRGYPAPAGAEAALDLTGLPAGLYLLRGAGPAQRLAVE
jgi:hypothetical protein